MLFPSEAFGTGREIPSTSLEKDRHSPASEYYANTSSRYKQVTHDEQWGSRSRCLQRLRSSILAMVRPI